MAMNTAPTHHPDSELLLARATGELDPAVALAVSGHLDLCARCARRAADLDMVGGVVLETTAPVVLSRDVLERILEQLNRPDEQPEERDGMAAEKLRALGLARVPRSLRALTAAAAEIHGWKKRPGGIREFTLRKEPTGAELRYLLIPPGSGVPRHAHGGMEFTLVVTGAFRDETGFYRPGDLAVCTEDLTHRPVSRGAEPCLALVVNSAPVRFTGVPGLIQRALGAA